MHTQDQGNGEYLSRGIRKHCDGYIALTFSESKTFKTFEGARKWMVRRGYAADGSKLEQRQP